MNPFAHLYKKCNTGDPAEKYANLADFPHMLDIELTSLCNFRCLMCPTGNLSLQRDAVFMNSETWALIYAQCARRAEGLRFIGWGEPLLHPNVIGIIADATEEGLLTHINTNASKLDKRMAGRLVGAGLSSIKFSFQGVDKASYAEMRNIDYFENVIDAIDTMWLARLGGSRPWISVSTSTTYETPEQIEAFCDRITPMVDELSIGKTIFDFMDMDEVKLKDDDREQLEHLKGLESGEKRHPVPCPEVYDKLSIHADGSVVLCCNDFNGVVDLGNVNETRIDEMWRHPKIEAYRTRLAKKDYNAPLCETCFDYMDCTVAA